MDSRGPGTGVFGQGIYCPNWEVDVPNGCARRWPRWQNDALLRTYMEELRSANVLVDVNPCWYFGFEDMYQLRRWFSVSRCRRLRYASNGVVIREYIGPTAIVGDKQAVMHFEGATRARTFHVYTGKELQCPGTTATAAPVPIAG